MYGDGFFITVSQIYRCMLFNGIYTNILWQKVSVYIYHCHLSCLWNFSKIQIPMLIYCQIVYRGVTIRQFSDVFACVYQYFYYWEVCCQSQADNLIEVWGSS